jgi:hypothetical protein
MSERCRTCKAPIRWAVTEQGRPIPLDLDPQPDGNICLAAAHAHGGMARAIVIPEQRRADWEGELYRAHWATCEFADEHRRRT